MTPGRKICLLLFFLGLCAGGALVRLLPPAPDRAPTPAELYAAIGCHLNTLRAADYPNARRQTSSDLQQRCNPSQFAELLQSGLNPVPTAVRVEFGAVESREHRARIEVFFIGRDSRVTPCIYTLIREEGAWKIDRVRVIRPGKSGVTLGGILS